MKATLPQLERFVYEKTIRRAMTETLAHHCNATIASSFRPILPQMPVAKEKAAGQPENAEAQVAVQGQLNTEGIAAQEVERKVLILWQPDPDPFSGLLAHERPPYDHPDLALGQTIVVDPLAESIQRTHLRAALTEASWSMDQLVQDFSRPVVQAELAALRDDDKPSGTTLREEKQMEISPTSGADAAAATNKRNIKR